MLIKKFNSTENVKKWQTFLKSLGHDTQPDRIFGPKTKTGTMNFQTKFKLNSDGIVGEQTLSVAMANGFTGFGNVVQASKLILISAGHTNVPGQDRGVAANGLIEGVEALKVRNRVM